MQEMPYSELLAWQVYFDTRPPEWRDDFRASVIASSMGAKGVSKAFPSLTAMEKHKKKSTLNIENSAVMSFLKSAIGGDKIAID